jgi:hypothetical protein
MIDPPEATVHIGETQSLWLLLTALSTQESTGRSRGERRQHNQRGRRWERITLGSPIKWALAGVLRVIAVLVDAVRAAHQQAQTSPGSHLSRNYISLVLWRLAGIVSFNSKVLPALAILILSWQIISIKSQRRSSGSITSSSACWRYAISQV